MAFAIASGLPPGRAVDSHHRRSAGGAAGRLQRADRRAGAGAFIVIVYGIVQQHGVAGLWISTSLAGVLLMLMGFLRLGALVRFVAGEHHHRLHQRHCGADRAVAAQRRAGLPIAKMPGDFFGRMQAIAGHLAQWNLRAGAGAGLHAAAAWIWPRLMHHQSPLLRLDGITVRTLRACRRRSSPWCC